MRVSIFSQTTERWALMTFFMHHRAPSRGAPTVFKMLIHISSSGKSLPFYKLLDCGATKSHISAETQEARKLLLVRIHPCGLDTKHLRHFNRSGKNIPIAIGGRGIVQIKSAWHDYGSPEPAKVETQVVAATELRMGVLNSAIFSIGVKKNHLPQDRHPDDRAKLGSRLLPFATHYSI